MRCNERVPRGRRFSWLVGQLVCVQGKGHQGFMSKVNCFRNASKTSTNQVIWWVNYMVRLIHSSSSSSAALICHANSKKFAQRRQLIKLEGNPNRMKFSFRSQRKNQKADNFERFLSKHSNKNLDRIRRHSPSSDSVPQTTEQTELINQLIFR